MSTFQVTSDTAMSGRCQRHTFIENGEPLAYGDVIGLWQASSAFRALFIETLSASTFDAFRWETPGVSRSDLTRAFECVLVDDPGLERPADRTAFHEHFLSDGDGVVTFENLGGDALMVVPSPRAADTAYAHLAAFIRQGPEEQIHALWKTVGRAVDGRVSDRTLWLSTAGGGVPWLHVRLDSRPKYYTYAPYKRLA